MSIAWLEVEGLVDAVVLQFAREAAGVVFEQAREEVPQRIAIRRTLLESGRPVLVMPRRPCTVFGRRVALLWRDDLATVKAFRAAAAWLTHADSVDLIRARQSRRAEKLPPVVAELGIAAQLHTFPTTPHSFARTALGEIGKLGSDIVIMGAYSHGALRSMVSGSVTEQVLAQMDRPVFLCH
jgi:nucleotide-binding universal stress UspA family protein